MLERLANRHKIGVIRAIKGMMPTSEQLSFLSRPVLRIDTL